MHRRRFITNNQARWLWRKITEKVILKSAMSEAPTTPVNIDDDIENPKNETTLVYKNVTNVNINRVSYLRRHIGLQARIRAGLVFIRDATVIRVSNLIAISTKAGKVVKTEIITRASGLLMCLTYFTRYKGEVKTSLSANGVKADTVGVSSDTRVIQVIKNGSLSNADSINVSITEKIPVDINNAKIVYWIDPILEDGVLTVLQSYDANLVDGVLEVV